MRIPRITSARSLKTSSNRANGRNFDVNFSKNTNPGILLWSTVSFFFFFFTENLLRTRISRLLLSFCSLRKCCNYYNLLFYSLKEYFKICSSVKDKPFACLKKLSFLSKFQRTYSDFFFFFFFFFLRNVQEIPFQIFYFVRFIFLSLLKIFCDEWWLGRNIFMCSINESLRIFKNVNNSIASKMLCSPLESYSSSLKMSRISHCCVFTSIISVISTVN